MFPLISLRSARRKKERIQSRDWDEVLVSVHKRVGKSGSREKVQWNQKDSLLLTWETGFNLICVGQNLFSDQQISEGGRKFWDQVCIQLLQSISQRANHHAFFLYSQLCVVLILIIKGYALSIWDAHIRASYQSSSEKSLNSDCSVYCYVTNHHKFSS